ncbi:MAG: HPr kinase/phosphatase C-terminal domain-containing protein [Pseudomonadota bacterium]
MTATHHVIQATAVAINGRTLLIEGEPGAGKSSLALALIERGAELIGDDGVTLKRTDLDGDARIVVAPPPNIEGLLEVHGVGLARFPIAEPAPLALVLMLGVKDERLPENPVWRDILGCAIPTLPFAPGDIAPAERARVALELHGLSLPQRQTEN